MKQGWYRGKGAELREGGATEYTDEIGAQPEEFAYPWSSDRWQNVHQDLFERLADVR